MDMPKVQIKFPSTVGQIGFISVTGLFLILGCIPGTNTGLISSVENTDRLFESREVIEMPALIAVAVGSSIRFHAREKQFKLTNMCLDRF